MVSSEATDSLLLSEAPSDEITLRIGKRVAQSYKEELEAIR